MELERLSRTKNGSPIGRKGASDGSPTAGCDKSAVSVIHETTSLTIFLKLRHVAWQNTVDNNLHSGGKIWFAGVNTSYELTVPG